MVGWAHDDDICYLLFSLLSSAKLPLDWELRHDRNASQNLVGYHLSSFLLFYNYEYPMLSHYYFLQSFLSALFLTGGIMDNLGTLAFIK